MEMRQIIHQAFNIFSLTLLMISSNTFLHDVQNTKYKTSGRIFIVFQDTAFQS